VTYPKHTWWVTCEYDNLLDTKYKLDFLESLANSPKEKNYRENEITFHLEIVPKLKKEGIHEQEYTVDFRGF